jgi:subtilisin family serine protease
VTPKTPLIGVKVLGQNNRGFVSDILTGVLWAADHGADIANIASEALSRGLPSAAVNQVFNYANRRGMVIVVIAGNDGADLDHNGSSVEFFCDMPHVVCVSAVGALTFTRCPSVLHELRPVGAHVGDDKNINGNSSRAISRPPKTIANAATPATMKKRRSMPVRRRAPGRHRSFPLIYLRAWRRTA